MPDSPEVVIVLQTPMDIMPMKGRQPDLCALHGAKPVSKLYSIATSTFSSHGKQLWQERTRHD